MEVLYHEHGAETQSQELHVAEQRAVDVVDTHLLAGGAEQFDDGVDKEHEVYAPDLMVGAELRPYGLGIGRNGAVYRGRNVRHGLLHNVCYSSFSAATAALNRRPRSS